MKKHQALLAELAGHENRIDTVCDQGQAMIDDGHFAGDDIQQKIQGLKDRWNNLKVCKRETDRYTWNCCWYISQSVYSSPSLIRPPHLP